MPNNEKIKKDCKFKFCLILSIDIVSCAFTKNTRHFTILGLVWMNPGE
jgi:hypothetical protein